MVFNLGRHRTQTSHPEELIKFCEQEYKWSKSFISVSALKPSAFHLTTVLQDLSEDNKKVQIFRANHLLTNHTVVLKLIDLDEEELLDYVSFEINTIRQLHHPNLLPLLSSFVIERHLWNVITSAEYGSVDIWSRPNGIPELAIAIIVRDVLFALDYLHKRGIIHRAVCGPHILINSNGHCMLTGLKYSTSVLKDGRWHNTIHEFPQNALKIMNYFAPEILQQNITGYNSKSDIYSLGIVCCEMANGCVPFEDIQLTEMLLDKLTGNYPKPLDATCEEIINFPTDVEDLTPDVREKYNLYRGRTFSSSFHKFTKENCLHFDSYSRPTAAALLSHSFVKQAKKSHHNLLQLLKENCSPCLWSSHLTPMKQHAANSSASPSPSDTAHSKVPVDLLQKLSLKAGAAAPDGQCDVQWTFEP
ncbi:hypothetical protein TYRP_010168 [Tyrophagus putrescentiae]|nr:hypothetical protein TYRP_010168 [Tyrophagus putrescentiae]